jgi:cation diffusion facilitator family transporter
MLTTKEKAAWLSIVGISLLTLFQVAASIITGSISIRGDAVHSALDLIAATVTYIGVRISGKPADEDHPFGHGKVENVSSGVVAGLIFAAGGIIAYEAIKRLIVGATIEMVEVGIYVTVGAVVIDLLLSWYLLRASRETDSLALRAQAGHVFSDVLSSVAVLVGLVLVRVTGLVILDPIVALLVALLILRVGYVTVKQSLGGLVDARLPEAEEAEIKACLVERYAEVVSFHGLRTRRAGSQRYIDLHLVMPQDANVADTHEVCDQIEQDIASRLAGASVTIHVEPCTIECEQCSVVCSLRKKKR